MENNAVYVQQQYLGIGNVEYRTTHSMTKAHYHNTYEIYLQTKGEKYITIENVHHHLVLGDLVLIEPYAMHLTESRDSSYCQRFVMNIYTPIMLNILTENELNSMLSEMHSFIIHLDEAQFEKAYHILSNIYDYSLRNDVLSKKLMYSATFEIMDFICRLNAPGLNLDLGIIEDNPIAQALRYVHNNYSENITLDFISKYVNMSKSNFCLVFNKAIGETFVHYLNHVRISHAHRLISETSLPIKEVAEKTGFSSTSYMTSIFKKYTNTTPGELRKMQKKSFPS